MRKLICMSIVLTLLILGSNAAMAGCKKFNGRATGPSFDFSCAGFEFCITYKATGTLAGEEVYSFIGNVFDIFPTDPDTLGLVAEVVWHTDEGDVFGTDLGIIDFRTFNSVSMTTITGGTGKWEDASGQVLNACGVDGDCDLTGDICTP